MTKSADEIAAAKAAAIARLHPSVRKLLPDDFDFPMPKVWGLSEEKKRIQEGPWMDHVRDLLPPAETFYVDAAAVAAVSAHLDAVRGVRRHGRLVRDRPVTT